MKLNDIFTIRLDEVRQAPSNLKQFANSPEADGIMAGFEAELIFKDQSDAADYDDDPQENYDEDRPTNSIDDIIDFFDVGDYNSGSELSRLQALLETSWNNWLATESDEYFYRNAERIVRDWIEGAEWDWTEQITDALIRYGYSEEDIAAAFEAKKAIHKARLSYDDSEIAAAREKYKDAFGIFVDGQQLATDELNELVNQAIEEGNDDYRDAQKNAREAFEEDADQRDWLESVGLDNMSDVASEFDIITWPYWDRENGDGEGGYSESAARRLADTLINVIPSDQKIKTTNWAGKNKDLDTWYFESDGSITPKNSADLPVEIVSPPMPLKQCLEVMEKFFEWANDHDAYTNGTTGFHMGVSMPEQDTSKVDYVKLTLFLGDKYVLEQFKRLGNTYCKSAMKKIEDAIAEGRVSPKKALSALREGLDRAASEILADNQGFGKFTSINPKDRYIEFRSAGNTDYSRNIEKLQTTLSRYAQAMWIASHPEAYRDEYQKKLYKLLSPSEDKTDTIRELAKLSAGKTSDAKIDDWANRMREILQRSRARNLSTKGDKLLVWNVKLKGFNTSYGDVVAKTAAEAIQVCKDYDDDWRRYDNSKFTAEPVKVASAEQVARYEAKQADISKEKIKGPKWEVYNKLTGDAVHQFDNPENTIQSGVGIALSWYTALPADERPEAAGNLGVRPASDESSVGPAARYRIYNTRSGVGTTTERVFTSGEAAVDWARDNYPETFPSSDIVTASVLALPPIETEPQNFPAPDDEPVPVSDYNGNYVIRRKDPDTGRSTGPVILRFRAPNIESATRKALAWARYNGLHNQIRLAHIDDPSTQRWFRGEPEPESDQPPRTGGQFNGRWNIINSNTGEVLHTFTLRVNDESLANEVAGDWATNNNFDDPVRAVPQMS